MSVELFTGLEVPWPDTEDGQYARAYLGPLLEHGPQAYIGNVSTTMGVLLVDGKVVLPISINEGNEEEYGNAWVCSPYTHYVTYAKEELRVLESRVLRAVLGGALTGLGALCRFSGVNQVVLVNNWLLSTNLYPAIEPGQLAAVVAFLRERFPGHAIGFCSVNSALVDACADAVLVLGRSISLATPGEQETRHRKRWRRDLRLIERNGYTVVEPGPNEAARIVELYNLLYLDKYSRNNPQFTERFIGEMPFSYRGLVKDGRMDGVLGYFRRDGVMTTPIFGYDTGLPQRIGLYRMLSAVVYDLADREGLVVNDSAGAAGFKRLRGAVPDIEYRAVYVAHLPWRRRFGWTALATLLERIAVPMMRRYEL